MPQQDAYSDIAVIDTAASCYVRSNKDPQAVLRGHQKKKIGKYGERVQIVGTFAPLVHSVFGTLAPEAEAVLAHLVHRLDASVSQAMSWVHSPKVLSVPKGPLRTDPGPSTLKCSIRSQRVMEDCILC